MAKQLRGFAYFIKMVVAIYDVIIGLASLVVAISTLKFWIIPLALICFCVPITVACYGVILNYEHKAEELELLTKIAKNTRTKS